MTQTEAHQRCMCARACVCVYHGKLVEVRLRLHAEGDPALAVRGKSPRGRRPVLDLSVLVCGHHTLVHRVVLHGSGTMTTTAREWRGRERRWSRSEKTIETERYRGRSQRDRERDAHTHTHISMTDAQHSSEVRMKCMHDSQSEHCRGIEGVEERQYAHTSPERSHTHEIRARNTSQWYD